MEFSLNQLSQHEKIYFFSFGGENKSFRVGKCQLAFSVSQQQLRNSDNETLFPKFFVGSIGFKRKNPNASNNARQ